MSAAAEGSAPRGRALALLSLAALGVVYGDIGTSPLYALKEAFTGEHHVDLTPENVIGVLSLVFWAMVFVVAFKYIGFVMRADNRGEGGILALLALVRPRGGVTGTHWMLVGLGLVGTALLYGDGIITPAITVLGAVEGLSVKAPALSHLVVPISVLILAGLFAVQKHGTAAIGRMFGPVMIVWFVAIAMLGVHGILMEPSVLRAVNPWHGIDFFRRDGVQGFLVLGAVVLVITGTEALYADMGHFGRRPIRLTWFVVVQPALLLNYFGQSANLLAHPDGVTNPFFTLVPSAFQIPMVVLATLAAVVASQALISGAFSLTQQAVQLGYSPRVTIRHTSRTEFGQIYIPEVNQILGVLCILLVLGFRSSSALAAAYGIAVTGTMIITSLLFYRVARDQWHWSFLRAGLLSGVFVAVDLAFFGANLIKVEEGGWFPLVVAVIVFTLMTTWKRGREKMADIVRDNSLPIALFLEDVSRRQPYRVPGTAVFLTSAQDGAPPVLLHHLKHNKVLHERVILLSILTEEIPQVADADRVAWRELGQGFHWVTARYGFMETPDVPAMLTSLGQRPAAQAAGLGHMNVMQTSFYLGRETLLAVHSGRRAAAVNPSLFSMAFWRKRLFIIMTRNARTATAFFNLPPNRVVELGAQIQI